MEDVMKLIAILQIGSVISSIILCSTRHTEDYVKREHELSDKEKSTRSTRSTRSSSKSRSLKVVRKRVKPLDDDEDEHIVRKATVAPDIAKTVRSRRKRPSKKPELKGFVIGSDRSVRRLEDQSLYITAPLSRREIDVDVYCNDLPSKRQPPPQKKKDPIRNANRSSNDTHGEKLEHRRPPSYKLKNTSRREDVPLKKKTSIFAKFKFKKKSKKLSKRESYFAPDDDA